MTSPPPSAEPSRPGPPSRWRRARVLGWSLSLSGAALVLVTAVALVRWVEHAPPPPFLTAERIGPREAPEPAPKPRHFLRLAGSGSNLPLTRALADAFVATRPWLRVRVHESIGSSGGVRATDDQAVEIGLISRPLRERERALELDVIPYARVAVVVAANPTVAVRSVDREALIDYYLGHRTHWSDGTPVTVLQREEGDSSHGAVGKAIPAFAQADAESREANRWRVLLHDRAMQEALLSTPGAIGLFDQGLATIQELPLATLEFEGIRPTEEAVRSGDYPLTKDLAFVVPGNSREPDPLAMQFIAFVFSREGQQLIRDSGYVPADPPEHSIFAQLRQVGPPPPPRPQPQPQPQPRAVEETEAETETETETETGTDG